MFIFIRYSYDYQNKAHSFTMPCAAIATMECWGAEGGPIINTYTHYRGGCGGYVKGTISLPSNLNLYVYVGGAGTKNGETRTFNGGGRCAATDDGCASGGGATDIRLRSGNWNDFNSLLSRIIVAGGGAGAERTNPAGAAGGLTSYTSKGGGNATQSSGYRLGYGEDADLGASASGGGGGYWGGLTSNCPGNYQGETYRLSSAGGSSFIAGHNGCLAILSATTSTRNILDNRNVATATTETYDVVTMKSGSNASVVTYNNTDYSFTNTSMIDGRGYSWTTSKGGLTNQTKPGGGTEIGHTGNGYARITLTH
ncbi:Glycine rich protein [Prevotellaceae bacterium MN60]|nr:Glycine rich protein [Prevotellaceae bacterium MN60]